MSVSTFVTRQVYEISKVLLVVQLVETWTGCCGRNVEGRVGRFVVVCSVISQRHGVVSGRFGVKRRVFAWARHNHLKNRVSWLELDC